MTAEHALDRLASPACFPHAPAAVQLVQTHLSVVCLTGEFVYKLKKAVTLPFVDFAPLAARRQACRDEVRLNRRWCPDTYLGTAALRPGPDGQLRFAALGDDQGPADVDVAVVMRTLPHERMLDELLRNHTVTPSEIEALSRLVAEFHARSEPVPTAIATATPTQLADFAAANFRELSALPHGQPGALLQALQAASAADFNRLLPTLQHRAAHGHVVDGHGDLHARNVCMTVPPTIYDCLEFAPALRIGDVATEVAFLVMDLRYRGARPLADVFARTYATARGDADLVALLPTLCGYRAMVRAKVAALTIAAPEVPAADREAARHSVKKHMQLAAAFAAEARGPSWLVACGPPASGKSRLCTQLAELTQWPLWATDVVRKQLAGLAPTERARPEHYSDEFSRRTYDTLFAHAKDAVQAGERVVLLDGNFATPELRTLALARAAAAGARVQFVHVDVDVATAIARAAMRQHDPREASDAGPEVTATRHARFQPPGTEAPRCVRVDGRRVTDDLVPEVLAAMLGTDPSFAAPAPSGSRATLRSWERRVWTLLTVLLWCTMLPGGIAPWLGGASPGLGNAFGFVCETVAALWLPFGTLALLLLLATLTRRRLRHALALAPLALLPFLHAIGFGPASAPPTGAPTFRVASMNLAFQNSDSVGAIASLQAINADVLVLTEFTATWETALATFAANFPHRWVTATPPADARWLGPFRIAVWSRLPADAPPETTFLHGYNAQLRVALQWQGRTLWLHAVHPMPPFPWRGYRHAYWERCDLLDWLRASPRPALVVGDLNATPRSAFLQSLRTLGFANASAQVLGRSPGTWPMDRPWAAPFRVAIDHVLVDDAFAAHTFRLGEPGGSDHAPIVAELSWRQD